MKKFIFKISLYLTLFILVNLFIYYLFINKLYIEYNQYNNNGTVFLMADSHGDALKSFPEKYGIMNFSYESDSYFDIERKLKYLIKESKVDKIILTFDNHCFSYYREVINNESKSIYFGSIFSDDKSAYENFKSKYIRYYLPVFNNNSPTLIKVDLFKRLNKKNREENLNDLSKLNEEEQTKESIKRLSIQFDSRKYSEKLVKSFENIIEIAKANNIEVIAIKFPLSKNYYTNLLAFDHLEIDGLLKEKKIRIIDFQKIYFDKDEYFMDVDHLNDEGAVLFSKILNDSINKITKNELESIR